MKNQSLVFLVLLLIPMMSKALTHVDNSKPIHVAVSENEIFMRFEGPVRYKDTDLFNSAPVSDYLMITNTTNGLLVQAKQEFPELRVQLARVDKEQVYLIDFYYSKESSDIKIVDSPPVDENTRYETKDDYISDCNFIGCVKDVRAKLLRHGFQRHYAPERLVDPLPGIHMSTKKDQVKLHKKFLSTTLETILYRGYKLIIVEVKNQTKVSQTIDPRNIFHRNINMISAYSWKLNAKGSDGDSTLLFIVSEV